MHSIAASGQQGDISTTKKDSLSKVLQPVTQLLPRSTTQYLDKKSLAQLGIKDSLPDINKQGKDFFQRRFNNVKRVVGDSMKAIIPLDKYSTAYQQLIKGTADDIKKQIAKPISIDEAGLSFDAQLNNAPVDSFASQNYYLLDLRVAGNAMDIPFTILYQNHDYPFIDNQNLNRFSFRYDRNAYMQGLKKKLQGKIDPKDYLPKISDPVDLLKNTAETALKKDVNELRENYKGLLDDKISQVGNMDDLVSKNTSTIRQQMMSSEWLKEIQRKSEMLSQYQARINSGQPYNQEEYEQLKKDIEKYQGVVKLVNKMEEHKVKWEKSGLVQKIKESGLAKKEKVKQLLNDPTVIAKASKEKLNLNSIQKLFLKITKLDIGQSTGALTSPGNNDFLMNGLNTAFLSNKTSIGAIAGGQRTFNSLSDMSFTNSMYNTNNRLMGVSLGKGKPGTGNQSMVSLLMAQTASVSNPFFSSYSSPRSSMVAAINRKIEVNKRNRIEIELSKSVSQFGDRGNKEPGIHNQLLSADNFFGSAAISVNYHGFYQKAALQNDFYFRTSGMNYDNPAVSFEPSGSKEAGIHLRKQLLKNKMQVMVKSDLREYKFSSLTNNKYRNSYYMVDAKWKMKKGQYVSLRYQPVKSVKISDGLRHVNAETQRLSVIASLAKKISGHQYRNTVNLAYQGNKYAYDQSGLLVSNTSVQFSSLQNVMVGKYSFFSNTLYNYVDNASNFIYFNTSFSSELGVSYTVGKFLAASSSFNYQSVSGWYSQVALRQSLAGQLGKRVNLNLYIDAGKNIKLYQPTPFGTVRGELSIQYMVNQN
jgi:hypothetical protein